MPVSLSVHERHIILIAAVYLERERQLLAELEEVREALKKLENNGTEIKYPQGYNPKWVWKDKITYLLKDTFLPLSTTEIVNKFLQIEPDFDRKKVTASISATISTHIKTGHFTKYNSDGETLYDISPLDKEYKAGDEFNEQDDKLDDL